MSAPRVRVFPGPGALEEALVGEIRQEAAGALASRGVFHLGLSGGSTPRRLYERLAGVLPGAEGWHLWFGDERRVPPGDPASNQRMVREAWLDRARGKPPVLHPMDGVGDPRTAARRYADELLRETEGGVLDLVLLGLGSDGHTASLFPGDPAVDEVEAQVLAVDPPGIEPPRLTLTRGTLARARRLDWVVTGTPKATVVARVLGGGAQELPAARIAVARATWWLDQDAARDLVPGSLGP